jgi:cysteine desulfurase
MIYFDNASSSKPSLKCLDVFKEESIKSFANPSSIHKLAMINSSNISRIKDNILHKVGLDDKYDVIFTSGATESNNLAILGYCRKNKNRGNQIITTNVEHESVLNPFLELEKEGFVVKYLHVNENGEISLDELKSLISKQTILVSIMASNNEVGSVLDIVGASKIIKDYPKCVFHSDCVQAFGKIPLQLSSLDMITITGHKIHGIKGIGALILKKKLLIEPIIYGGNQQSGVRSGTLDYPSIASFNETINEAINNLQKADIYVLNLHNHMIEELKKIEEIAINTPLENFNPYIVCFSLKTKKASVVVEALSNEGIYVNSVSACNSKREDSSYVLLAMNKDYQIAKNPIRVSFSEENTIEEIDIFIEKLKAILNTIR